MNQDDARFRTSSNEHGRRIERVLEARLETHPEHVAKLIRQDRVWVQEVPVGFGARVERGDLVQIRPAAPKPAPLPNRKVRVRVLHEDPDVVAVFKPSGLACHAGPGHGSDTLIHGLVALYPELAELGSERGYGLVHRLDLPTSGVLVVGRTAAGYDGLRAAFEAREVSKRYLALVGDDLPNEATVAAPVGGKDALTELRVLERRGGVSLVEARPRTGRTHQIRIHLASLGAPVLHDTRHGHGRDKQTGALFLSRLALHAESLSLTHPTRGETLSVQHDWPRDLRKAWKRAASLGETA